MNKWIGTGRLTKDPEMRFTANSGLAVTTFTLAVDRPFKNANGEKEADFINCRAWRKLAEIMANNLAKGSKILVVGSIQTGSYTAQDGTKKYTTEVVVETFEFCESKKGNTAGGAANYNEADADAGFFPVENDDDIPF